MYDAGNVVVLLEDGMRIVKDAQVYVVIFNWLTRNLSYALHYCGVAAAIVIYRYHFEALLYKVYNRMRANVATSTGNQYFFHITKKTKKNRSG